MTDNSYLVGTTVFAKLKGYPWWPARIEHDNDLPENVKSKKPKQRPVWPVFFYGSYDYGWFGPTELKPFDSVAAEKAKNALKKGNALKEAIGEALNPSLMMDRSVVTTPDEYGETDDLDNADNDDAPKPAKKRTATGSSTKTKKTTSKSTASNEQESLSEGESSPTRKKRRASTSEDQSMKQSPVKRSTIPKTGAKDSVHKKRAVGRPDSDSRSVDSELELVGIGNGHARKPEEEGGDMGDLARAKRKMHTGQPNERLLKLRHKLQKLLLAEGLSDDVLVQNLGRADPVMSEVESFEIDLQLLRDTKIGRLMKKISGMQFSRDQYHIVDRSNKLLQQYKTMMEKAQESGGTASPGESGPAPAAVVAAVAAIVEQSANEDAVAASSDGTTSDSSPQVATGQLEKQEGHTESTA
ncbi:hypothetical protein BGZ83_012155 [Gryganskiella cystojenkinii]|nr:hypothetical protein BGZ83_012155 [Gryganskiella cystojenkinii]